MIRTRLKPSKLHAGGVGVFAILPIKKGTVVFDTFASETVSIPREHFKRLPKAVQKMYTDFAMQVGTNYLPPRDFTKMGMFWYICHSDKPNCYYVEGEAYMAKRNIRAGEELSVDYRLFGKRSKVGDVKLLPK